MKNIIFVICFMTLVLMTTSLKIKNLNVPDMVVVDKESPEILDCDFEVSNMTNLVVKWFHDEEPIYQWIYGHVPQEIGSFRGKLDLNYQPADNNVYRALKIKQLSLDMAGIYKCVVFNFVDEEEQSKQMIVVNRPKKLEILQLSTADDNTVTFACSAFGVYPEPHLNISYAKGNIFVDIENESVKNEDSLYNVTQLVTLNREDLEDLSDLVCELRIPDTNYSIEKTLQYYSDIASAFIASPWIIIIASLTAYISI